MTLLKDELVKKIAEDIENMKKSFQAGCDKIVGKLTALGYEPEAPQGPDEINYQIQCIYDERYNKGYADGLAQSTPQNAKIKYTYHHHVDSCYTNRTGTIVMRYNSDSHQGDGHDWVDIQFVCSSCSTMVGRRGTGNPGWGVQEAGGVHGCGRAITCGWREGEIEKAEIVYSKK